MVDDDSLVAPNGPRLAPDVRLIGAGRRRGDGLVHDVSVGLRQGRLREYAPPGAVSRGADGQLAPLAGYEQAWRDGCARFLDQAQRLYAAAPICVPRIWRVGDAASGAWVITAPSGEPLAHTLASGLAIEPRNVIRIARDLADALAMIHAYGVTHLDICSETVSITGGEVVLSDFAVDNRAFLRLLGSGEGLVRPGYSPIEMYEGGQPLGPATDIHAASALVYRLMAGADPPPWRERWRGAGPLPIPGAEAYPPPFVEAIRRGLAIEPEHRFADALTWRQAMGEPPPLVDLAKSAAIAPDVHEASEARWPPDPVPRPPPIGAHRSSNWLVAVIVGVLALTTIVLAVFLLRPAATASEEAPALYVATGPANVRSAPGPGAEVVARLVVGDRVTGVMTIADSGERWLRISQGPHVGNFVWARNLALPGGAPAAAARPAETPAIANAAAPVAEPSDAELSRWIVGGWAFVSSGCGTDGGDYLAADGRYGDFTQEGRWRIENGRLITTITHRMDESDETEPFMRRLDQPRTDATPIKRDGADRMTRIVDGVPARMMRCPDANHEFIN